MAEFCDKFAGWQAAQGTGPQFAIYSIERPKGRAERRPLRGAGKTPGTGTAEEARRFGNGHCDRRHKRSTFGNIFRNNLKLWRITLWYLAEEHSKIGCPHFSMTFSMMTSDISAI